MYWAEQYLKCKQELYPYSSAFSRQQDCDAVRAAACWESCRKAARHQCRMASAQARKQAPPLNAAINLKRALTSGSHLC